MQILKFGGSSVANPDRIRACGHDRHIQCALDLLERPTYDAIEREL